MPDGPPAPRPEKAYYVTTPIYYVNDAPHIGHAYTTVAGDVLTRWHRQRGEDVWYLTGTDEHGAEGAPPAERSGVTPQEWTDQLVEDDVEAGPRDDRHRQRRLHPHHRAAAHRAGPGVLADAVRQGRGLQGRVRGPVLRGLRGVQAAGRAARRRGRRGRPEAVPDPRPPGRDALARRTTSSGSPRTPTGCSSSTRRNPTFVQPESARNEVLSFVAGPAGPVDHPRRPSTGASRCPWDDEHVLYVWIDALLNYAHRRGLRRPTRSSSRALWPADVHLVGKDILRFHAVIWPAMLMAAGARPPRKVFAHGWLLVGGEKMSKSKLTGIPPREITDDFGSDAFRYYFLRAIPFGQDGSFSWEDMTRALQRRARRPARQPRVPGRLDGRPVLRRRAARDGRRAGAGRGGCRRRRRGRGRHRPDRPAGRDPGRDGLRPGRQQLRHREGAVEGRQGRVARRRPRPILYTTAEALRVVRRAAQPGDAQGVPQRCGPRSAPRTRSAPLGGRARPGRRYAGGSCRGGTRPSDRESEPLFPRHRRTTGRAG